MYSSLSKVPVKPMVGKEKRSPSEQLQVDPLLEYLPWGERV